MDFTKTGKFRRVNADSKVANRRLSNPGMMLKRRTGISERFRVHTRERRVPSGSLSGAAKAMVSKLPIARIALVFGLIAIASIGVLIGASAFAKSRQITVRLENGPLKYDIVTSARTVRELLEQQKTHLGGNDVVTPVQNTRLENGTIITINRAIIIFITSKGVMTQQYMTGGTVEDALNKAKIEYDQDDEISPSLEVPLTAGMRIKHVVVETETLTELQNIDYSTIYQKTSTLLKGKTKVSKSGQQGIQTREIQVVYRDSIEVSRTEISNVVTKAPESRIILKGTGVAPTVNTDKGTTGKGNTGKGNTGTSTDTSTDTSTSGDTGDDDEEENTDTDNVGGHYGDVKAEDLVIPSIPAQFETIYYMQITAYTHTGRKTARGGWPQYTRTLSKPGSIAVNPKAIPYGTLLYVTGYGYCVAEDTGANDTDSSRMGDVFMNTKSECYKWGRRRNVAVYIVQYDYKR